MSCCLTKLFKPLTKLQPVTQVKPATVNPDEMETMAMLFADECLADPAMAEDDHTAEAIGDDGSRRQALKDPLPKCFFYLLDLQPWSNDVKEHLLFVTFGAFLAHIDVFFENFFLRM